MPVLSSSAHQIILDEAFPDLAEQGATPDVRIALESPNNLLQLDLYAVAEANRCLYKLQTWVDMLFEMLAPYGELRLHSAVPSDEEAFYLRHGETRESLKVRLNDCVGSVVILIAVVGDNKRCYSEFLILDMCHSCWCIVGMDLVQACKQCSCHSVVVSVGCA